MVVNILCYITFHQSKRQLGRKNGKEEGGEKEKGRKERREKKGSKQGGWKEKQQKDKRQNDAKLCQNTPFWNMALKPFLLTFF